MIIIKKIQKQAKVSKWLQTRSLQILPNKHAHALKTFESEYIDLCPILIRESDNRIAIGMKNCHPPQYHVSCVPCHLWPFSCRVPLVPNTHADYSQWKGPLYLSYLQELERMAPQPQRRLCPTAYRWHQILTSWIVGRDYQVLGLKIIHTSSTLMSHYVLVTPSTRWALS